MPRKQRRRRKKIIVGNEQPPIPIQCPSQNLADLKIDQSQPSLLDLPHEMVATILTLFKNKAQLDPAGAACRTMYHHSRYPFAQRNYLAIILKIACFI